jgi:hypothetical protein
MLLLLHARLGLLRWRQLVLPLYLVTSLLGTTLLTPHSTFPFRWILRAAFASGGVVVNQG